MASALSYAIGTSIAVSVLIMNKINYTFLAIKNTINSLFYMPMQLKISNLSSNLHSAVIMKINERKYVFNMFEGFQRFCLENSQSMADIHAVFSPDLLNLPGVIGYYLTMGDIKKGFCNFISNLNLDLHKIYPFAYREDFTFLETNNSFYRDEYISVETIAEPEMGRKNKSNFFIEIKKIPGQLLIEKIPKNIPKHFYKNLKNKERIIFDGIKYNGSDFCGKDIFLGDILIVYTENDFHLLNNFAEKSEMIFCDKMISFEYFRKNFSNKQVFLMQKNQFVEFKEQYKNQTVFNQIDKNFLLPIYSSLNNSISIKKENLLQNGDNFIYNTTSKSLELIRNEEFIDLKPVENIFPNNYVLFLGTGCAIPSTNRNVSGILCNFNSFCVLLDCGEDSIGQILRTYGDLSVLKTLKYIFISHSHADHFLGIASILSLNLNTKITVLGPKCVEPFLNLYSEYFNFISTENLTDIIFDEIKFNFCNAEHISDSKSVSLISELYKISYSGDTRPNKAFAKIAQNSTLMIHEATFEDDQEDLALKTGHSTVSEAKQIFNLSESNKLILTHFSQRNRSTMYDKEKAVDFLMINLNEI
ncbi:hypothetical protein NUSPORA_00806 [Nucleospora cyclopteri]